MKTFLSLVLALGTLNSFAADKPLTTDYKVSAEESKVSWIGKKVTGQHNGSLKVKSGTIKVQGDLITGGEIIVDINSMTVDDITEKEYQDKFVGHMKSDDFFNTEKFPEAKLVIKNSKKTKDGVMVNADLTIKGVTKPVNFLANVKNEGQKVTGKADLNVDRTNFGLKYGSGKFFKGLGDKMIHDEFGLTVDIVASK